MDNLLLSLENTALSQWVLGSIWGYPILLTFHSLGLGLLVGMLVIVALRVLGVAREMPLASLRPLLPWVWAGFAMNAISGIILFMADATKDYHSTSFRVKLVCIVIGVLFALHLQKRLPGYAGQSSGVAAEVTPSRLFAGISLLSWTGATVAGRLIAYLG